MSFEALIPGFPFLAYAQAPTGGTVRGTHTMTRATAANIVALGRPCKRLGPVTASTGGTFRLTYVRSHASIKQLALAFAYRADPDILAASATISVTLTLRDAMGNSVAPPDSTLRRIPTAFSGAPVTAERGTLSPTGDVHVGGVGYLDLDACAATLTDPTWELEFVFARSGGDVTLEWIEAWECPRARVFDTDAHGALTGPLNPGNPIVAGSVTTSGYERILKTIEGGVAASRSYLNVAWPVDTTATIPSTASVVDFAPFEHMREDASTPWPWRFRPRVVYKPNDAQGEPARVRFLYYADGGGTGTIRTDSGSSSGPVDVTGLTGASWQWSPWASLDVPTNGADGICTVRFTGKVSAGTLYLAGIALEEHP